MGEPTTNTTPRQEEFPSNMFEKDMGRREAIGGILKLFGFKVASDTARVMAQDQAVAIATPNNNPRTAGTPEKLEKTGFETMVQGILEQIKSLDSQFKEGKINVDEYKQALESLIKNEKNITDETIRTGNKVNSALKKAFDSMQDSNPKKATIKALGMQITSLIQNISQGNNLIKAMRLLIKASEQFPQETLLISVTYFKNIITEIDKRSDKVIAGIDNLGKEWGKVATEEMQGAKDEIIALMGKEGAVEIKGSNLLKNPSFKMKNDEVDGWGLSDKITKLDSKKGELKITLTPNKQGLGHFYLRQTIKLKQGKYRIALPVVSESTPGIALLEVINKKTDAKIGGKLNKGILESTIEITDAATEVDILVYLTLSNVKKGTLPPGPAEVKYGTIVLAEQK